MMGDEAAPVFMWSTPDLRSLGGCLPAGLVGHWSPGQQKLVKSLDERADGWRVETSALLLRLYVT